MTKSRLNEEGRVASLSERPWTIQELADFLNVPVATIYAWRYRGEGPRGFRVGRHVRFLPQDVQNFLQGQRDRERRNAEGGGAPSSLAEGRGAPPEPRSSSERGSPQ